MLTPEYLADVPESMVRLYAQAEADILADMARRIRAYDYWIPATEHQRRVLLEMGASEQEILRRLSRLTGKSTAELKKLMLDAGQQALAADNAIYRAHDLHPPPLRASKPMQQVLNAGYVRTDKLFRNLTRTTARTASGQLERALDLAYLQITSGGFDPNTAITHAVKNLAQQGIGSVRYPSGRVDTLETAVRRAVTTGVNQTALQLQTALAEELGSDLVEVTAHGGARPSHAVWQGRIYSLSGKSRKYPNFVQATGYGTGEGLGGWNCRHSFYPYFEGSARAYSPEQLQDYQAARYEYNGQKLTEYEASQRQRYLERQIRRWKREHVAMQAAGLDGTESAVKLRTWQEKQKDFLRQTGLKRQTAREQTHGFGNGEARKAAKDAENYYRQWSKSMGVDDRIKTLANYYDIKYNDSPTYELLKRYVQDVETGWISPNADFGNYLTQYNRIQHEIIGREAGGGIEITGQRNHFMQRVLGTAVDPEKYRREHRAISRSGVEIDDIKAALFTPERIDPPVVRKDGKRSIRYVGQSCVVTLNPDTGDLIQTNPRKKMKTNV